MNDKIIKINLKLIICKVRGYHKTYKAICRGEFFGCDCRTCGCRFMADLSRVQFPQFKNIIENCKDKINEKFPKYGNSWINTRFDDDFWQKRLDGEIKEIFMANNPKEFKDEIIDAINVLSMMYENAIYYKQNQMTKIIKGNVE